jgi:hypothetical protein
VVRVHALAALVVLIASCNSSASPDADADWDNGDRFDLSDVPLLVPNYSQTLPGGLDEVANDTPFAVDALQLDCDGCTCYAPHFDVTIEENCSESGQGLTAGIYRRYKIDDGPWTDWAQRDLKTCPGDVIHLNVGATVGSCHPLPFVAYQSGSLLDAPCLDKDAPAYNGRFSFHFVGDSFYSIDCSIPVSVGTYPAGTYTPASSILNTWPDWVIDYVPYDVPYQLNLASGAAAALFPAGTSFLATPVFWSSNDCKQPQ